jgi:DNA-binding PadR family transcriptional regulator
MHLRYALLALLADGEAHGYEILKRFDRRLGPYWHPNIGQVYQLLHELEARGLTRRRDVTVGTRLRRVFRVTERGRRALETWAIRKPGWPPPLRDEIYVRLLAAERRGVIALAEQLRRQRGAYDRHRELLAHQAPSADAPLVRRWIHTAALAHVDAYVGWIEACGRTLGDDAEQLAS